MGAFSPVRVNCIMPGPFLTDISKAWDLEAFRARAKETMPLGRGGEPEEPTSSPMGTCPRLRLASTARAGAGGDRAGGHGRP